MEQSDWSEYYNHGTTADVNHLRYWECNKNGQLASLKGINGAITHERKVITEITKLKTSVKLAGMLYEPAMQSVDR